VDVVAALALLSLRPAALGESIVVVLVAKLVVVAELHPVE